LKSSEYIAILQSKVVIDKEIAASLESIIEEYPYITEVDIRACLLFANEVLESNFFTQNTAL
jgi:uncharacterized protein (DUF433 family)